MPVVPGPGECTVCEINRDLLTRKDGADKSAQDAYVKIVGRVYSSIPFRVNQPENGYRNGHNASYYEEDQVRDGGSSYYDSPVPSTSERSGDMVAEEGGRRGFVEKQLSAAKRYIDSVVQTVVAPYPEVTSMLQHQCESYGMLSWNRRTVNGNSPDLRKFGPEQYPAKCPTCQEALATLFPEACNQWPQCAKYHNIIYILWSNYPQTTFNTHRFQAVSWHKRKHWLAFISSADQVLVYDFEDPDTRDPAVLTSDSQRIVEAVEWRPNSGATLSIACRGGIGIWSASFPGNIAPVRAGVVSIMGTPNRGTGARWSLVDFLKTTDNKPVTAIAWSPCGRLLASASRYGSAITIWEVSQGIGTPLRRGLAGIALLRWSPTGDYLLSAKLNGAFNLWETHKWTSEPWSAAGGNIVSAMWGPDGHVLLTAFDKTTTLGTLYFPSRPPSLDVHLLPLELPEINPITGGRGTIEKMAWDGTGERLAVSYTGGDAIYSGLIAIYDTRHTPIVSTTFLGFIRGPELGVKPLAFAFHDKLKQGALLAVCWSCGVCCAYPFLFRTH